MSHLWDIFHTLKISLEISLNKVFLFWIVLLVFDLEIFFDSIFSSRGCIVLGCDVHGSLWFPFLCYIRCTSKFILLHMDINYSIICWKCYTFFIFFVTLSKTTLSACLRQGPFPYSRLALSCRVPQTCLQSFCIKFLRAEIVGKCHHIPKLILKHGKIQKRK